MPFAEIDATTFSQFSSDLPAYDLDQLRKIHNARVLSDPDFSYLADLREIDLPLAQVTEVSLLESQREKDRDHRQGEQKRMFESLKRAYGYDDPTEQPAEVLPRDAVLLESARILAGMSLDTFEGRLAVQRIVPGISPLNDAHSDTPSTDQ